MNWKLERLFRLDTQVICSVIRVDPGLWWTPEMLSWRLCHFTARRLILALLMDWGSIGSWSICLCLIQTHRCQYLLCRRDCLCIPFPLLSTLCQRLFSACSSSLTDYMDNFDARISPATRILGNCWKHFAYFWCRYSVICIRYGYTCLGKEC